MFSFQLMSGSFEWAFPPEAISGTGQNASNPKIAIDPNGNAVAVWLENNLVKTKSKLADMEWSSEATLSGFNGSAPNIVIDLEGNATAVWLESGIVKSASKTLNGTWSGSVALSGSNAASPTLAVALDGDVIVAWARNGDIQTTTKPFGGNWQNQVTINASGSAIPHIAVGGTGSSSRAAVVWRAVASQVNVIYGASKLMSASSWGSKQIISDTSHQADRPKVAVDSEGNIVSVWFAYDVSQGDYSRVLVQSAGRTANGSWVNFSTLSDLGIGNPSNLSIEVGCDGLGNAVALWSTTYDNETYTVQSSVKPTYGAWSDPINLVEDNLYASGARLTVASLGDALAVYMFYNGLNLLIQTSELDTTGFMESTWSLPLTLSDATANAKPHIAAAIHDNKIQTAAIWVANTGMNNSVMATTGAKTIPMPPTNLAVVQSSTNFGVFTEYYNTLSWEASSDPNVVGYLIFRNGLFLEQVGSEVLEYVDNNKAQNGAVVYGVASIDDQGSHGKVETVNFP